MPHRLKPGARRCPLKRATQFLSRIVREREVETALKRVEKPR